MDPSTHEAFGNLVQTAIRVCQLKPPQAAIMLCDVVAQLSTASDDPDKTLEILIQRIRDSARLASRTHDENQEGPSSENRKGSGK